MTRRCRAQCSPLIIGKLLRELLPVRGGHVSFEFVEVTERDEDLFVIMRLINWEHESRGMQCPRPVTRGLLNRRT
ncbi:MAG: hypothetical protein HY791_30410 [Deltaproteobacteria bacterium]|nr:hypothetical protein [Deltaproteobacteria bacterium]